MNIKHTGAHLIFRLNKTSAIKRTILLALPYFVFIQPSSAQTLEARVEIVTLQPAARVRVTGRVTSEASEQTASGNNRWKFLDSYADAGNLSGRVSTFTAFNENNENLTIQQLAVGTFQTGVAASRWQYGMTLGAPEVATSAAHVSWLAANHGLLMLADLLPELQGSNDRQLPVRVTFVLPANWRIATSETKISANEFQVENPERAVFLVGSDWREAVGRVGKTELSVATVGERAFTDQEILNHAVSILTEHKRTFGEIPTNRVQLFLLPFPRTVERGRWRAETRGSNVVLITNPSTQKLFAVGGLHEQLRHELFHLWIPNALALSGEYSWFYEGFALYQALKTGVELQYVRFDGFLDTLARAHDVVRQEPLSSRKPLPQLSQNRWDNANSANLVYAKGLLAAFLCDLQLLDGSGGRRSLGAVFERIYNQHRRPANEQTANPAIFAILQKYPETNALVDQTIGNGDFSRWAEHLAAGGLRSELRGGKTHLSIVEKPSGKQKKLLERLGYKSTVQSGSSQRKQ